MDSLSVHLGHELLPSQVRPLGPGWKWNTWESSQVHASMLAPNDSFKVCPGHHGAHGAVVPIGAVRQWCPNSRNCQ